MLATIIPSGTGISTNTSPSIPPISGSLARDSSVVGSLYTGNGTQWIPSSFTNPTTVTGITLTNPGSAPQTALTPCTLFLWSSPDPTNTIIIKYFVLNVNANGGNSGLSAGFWVSPANTVPTNYIPTSLVSFQISTSPSTYINAAVFPAFVGQASSTNVNNQYVWLDNTGRIGILTPIASASVPQFGSFFGTYV